MPTMSLSTTPSLQQSPLYSGINLQLDAGSSWHQGHNIGVDDIGVDDFDFGVDDFGVDDFDMENAHLDAAESVTLVGSGYSGSLMQDKPRPVDDMEKPFPCPESSYLPRRNEHDVKHTFLETANAEIISPSTLEEENLNADDQMTDGIAVYHDDMTF